MSITSLVQVGSAPNDGSGDTIRNAFSTVNSNFDLLNGAIFTGEKATIISAVSVTGGYIISNSYVTANSVQANSFVSAGNLTVQSNGALIYGNVTIVGNLTVSGSQAASQSQTSSASILALHFSDTPFVVNDSRDIGTKFQYYNTSQQYSFLGWQNATSSLVYLDAVSESIGNVITGTFGNVKFGSLSLANTAATTSNTSGALQVAGGISTQGNLWVQNNIRSTSANIGNLSVTGYHVGNMNFIGTDTIFINGSPVQTAAQAFNGGAVALATIFFDVSPATALGTGAVRVAGGFSANGNVHVGGNVVTNGLSQGYLGNIMTANQPFVTGLGSLTGLTVNGQTNSQNIIPSLNQTYSLGSSNSTRWLKIWAFDTDLSGTVTSGIINASGLITATANIAVNSPSNAGLTTTQSTAYLFNENALNIRIGGAGTTFFNRITAANIAINTTNSGLTTSQSTVYLFNENASNIRIGGAGTTYFGSNLQATSTSTGATVNIGGFSVKSGNIYIGGSGGTAITHTGDILPSANLVYDLGSNTAWYNTFYGVSTQAKYADLAEKYRADATYESGTVVVFGGSAEITTTTQMADHRVAGVISTNPAYLMNAATEGLPVALRGRVPMKVIGPVSQGDLLVTSDSAGCAISVGGDVSYGVKIFAKSLETNEAVGEKIIEAVIL